MRDEEIRGQLAEEIEARSIQAKARVQESYEKDKEKHVQAFLKAMDELFRKYKEKPELGPIKYIWINCMRVSVETESYDYCLRAYGEMLFLDKFEAVVPYVAEYKLPIMQEDRQFLEKLVMSKVIRAKKYEVCDLRKWYEWNTYIKPMPQEIEDAIDRISSLQSYQEIEKQEGLKVYYGELMEYSEKEYEIEKE